MNGFEILDVENNVITTIVKPITADYLFDEIDTKNTVKEIDKEVERAEKRLKWLNDLKRLYLDYNNI